MIFVDTSVLVDFLAGRWTGPATRLRDLEREGTPFAIPMICCQEVLQGARDEAQWRKLSAVLETQIMVTARDTWATHLAAARIYFECRRLGLTIRSSVDCWIAQLVLEEDGQLLHDDQDFENIRRIRPLRTLTG